MRRTKIEVWLSPAAAEWLTEEARRRRMSRSALARECIELAVDRRRRAEPHAVEGMAYAELGDVEMAMRAEADRPAVRGCTVGGCSCPGFVKNPVKVGRCSECGHYFGEHR